jgi:hypothetical protein
MNPVEIPVSVVAPPLTPPPLPAAPTSSDAKKTGLKDSFITALFAVLSYGGVSLGQWLLDNQAGVNLGKYEWAKPLTVLVVTAFLKGLDRSVHEDPTDPSTGLIKL